MIIIEVEVPVMGKKFDFQIDEHVPLADVKEEVVEMICRKEQYALRGNIDRMLVWSPEGQQLDEAGTAADNGLRTGHRILLV